MVAFGFRYKQLAEEGEEDQADLVDQVRVEISFTTTTATTTITTIYISLKATMKDREWDNWKEDNPRGWGNKMGKRF